MTAAFWERDGLSDPQQWRGCREHGHIFIATAFIFGEIHDLSNLGTNCYLNTHLEHQVWMLDGKAY